MAGPIMLSPTENLRRLGELQFTFDRNQRHRHPFNANILPPTPSPTASISSFPQPDFIRAEPSSPSFFRDMQTCTWWLWVLALHLLSALIALIILAYEAATSPAAVPIVEIVWFLMSLTSLVISSFAFVTYRSSESVRHRHPDPVQAMRDEESQTELEPLTPRRRTTAARAAMTSLFSPVARTKAALSPPFTPVSQIGVARGGESAHNSLARPVAVPSLPEDPTVSTLSSFIAGYANQSPVHHA
ncbi:hypothetical protein F5Y15DRAFT_30561 [Xylariaceae sp. FL0016]|nr:hypothetical protein F5Y15DRAFT_30561 [Xylariaceae sp. FL0016]